MCFLYYLFWEKYGHRLSDSTYVCFSFCSDVDSMIKPVTKILLGTAVITLLLTLVLRETPEWIKRSNPFGGSFPPWILACAVIVFTRMRKRTRDFLKKCGW
ncbi:WD REPEAT PROTEIN [Salix purpurea]|uniref:WD REPEAT PROTEIN n=1 Tax=Salix purpurea TaxID=77065 RepID=A0A9Q0WUY8_SALPP|nr:WD REPEAT PROTEIN [Salix purpurea]